MSVAWLAEARDDGALAARVGRDGDRMVAEWPRRATLSVRRDGGDVRFQAHPEAEVADVAKLRRGAVGLLLAHLRGAIPLHGSAVVIDGRAAVFIGGTGLGKSTVAASLCDLAGASLLGDDAVTLERVADRFVVVALEDQHWLDAPAAQALGRRSDFGDVKVGLPALRSDVKQAPLALLVHLAFTEATGPRLVPMLGLEAVAGLLKQLTRFVVDEPAVARRDLAALADLVERTPVVRLDRPRELALLRPTAQMIAAALVGMTREEK